MPLPRSDVNTTEWTLRGPWRLTLNRFGRDFCALKLIHRDGWTIERTVRGEPMTPAILAATLADMLRSAMNQLQYLPDDLAAVTLEPETQDDR